MLCCGGGFEIARGDDFAYAWRVINPSSRRMTTVT
jgi:hypothetical protein